MNRQEKEQVIQSLKNDFNSSGASFVVGVKGLTVSQLQNLRKGLRAQGGKLKITKPRLMKLAVQDNADVSALDPFFKNQIGVVFAGKEPSKIAKILNDFAKNNGALELVAGCVEKQLYDKPLIKRIAELPSREVLLARLCGVLAGPITKLAVVVDMIAKKKAEQAS